MLMSSKDNPNTMRNALIEGIWAFTTFYVGAGAAGLRTDVVGWVYGGIGAFLTGFVGYLVKSYGLGKKEKKNGSE